MKYIHSIFLTLLSLSAFAQNYVDTLYTIATESDITYGTSVNFAGVDVDLKMDISYPVDAPERLCGNPLILLIHGGGFSTGSKTDPTIKRLREEFAKRGYVAAAINYRLGYFPSKISKNCNISGWNCLNVADSAEWYRAAYRGIQDAKGALRYLINNKEQYKINPALVFVAGESAGAFISLGVAYLDHPDEKPITAFAIAPVETPHSDYYSPCIKNSTYNIPIDDMDLNRPDLGSVDGELNPTDIDFQIRGVGSMFGGSITDLFSVTSNNTPPALYIFHQPNDLVVPYTRGRIFEGVNTCAMDNAGCANITDRPLAYGGNGLKNLLDTLNIAQELKPKLLFESTDNNANCIMQVFSPSTGGHQYDSFKTRTQNMATFFADEIINENCTVTFTRTIDNRRIRLFPNPASGSLNILGIEDNTVVTLTDNAGKVVLKETVSNAANKINISNLSDGYYHVMIFGKDGVFVGPLRKTGE
ncbi:MAG TPA: T9SS type A sorting domain-containing protein [Cytophagaceae bacterium]